MLAPEALEDLRGLDAHVRSRVREAIERHLRYEPAKLSRSRIKRLQGIRRPQYRLRVEEVRVFYDISGGTVEILAIVPKLEAAFGSPAQEKWNEKRSLVASERRLITLP